jgi:cysteine desulfurase/selenocysteine lyase
MNTELGGSRPCDADRVLDYVGLNVEKVRRDFAILNQMVKGKPLVYLDNAASTQKPGFVLDAIRDYYENDHSNVHRGVHTLSQRATEKFDAARSRVQRHLNAADFHEIIFTKGCTEAINLVANAWGRSNLKPGDVVLLSHMEHHANIVPWQIVTQATGAQIKVIPIDDNGDIDLDGLDRLLNEQVKFVSVVHVSNALGTVNPVKEIARRAHAVGAKVLVDGAQGAVHLKIDVQDLGVDFYTISGHKIYGPTGVGALYGKAELLEAMPPYQAGGDMIKTVSFAKTTYADLPNKFEPGTPHISGFIALASAIDYVDSIGLQTIANHEKELVSYALEALEEIPGLRVIGKPKERAGIISFVMDKAHPHDIGTILDAHGVAIRAGHHCCMPLMERLGVPATARASFAMYNTKAEVDVLIRSIAQVKEIFG